MAVLTAGQAFAAANLLKHQWNQGFQRIEVTKLASGWPFIPGRRTKKIFYEL